MKQFFLLLILSVPCFLKAQTQMEMQQDKPSTHGMLIFGKEKIYASHLPMFHSPHNYQIILELQLDEKIKKLFISDQQQHTEYTTYTIEPEVFILPEMIAHPKPFKANLYRGHFERGGIKIADTITVEIKQVVYFKKFDTAESKASSTDLILFGNAKEQFAAHCITNKRDFDQVMQIKYNFNTVFETANESFKMATVNKNENAVPGIGENTIEAFVNNKTISITLLKQLYIEFDDLK